MLIPTHTYKRTVLHNSICIEYVFFGGKFINVLSYTTHLKRSCNLKPIERCSLSFFHSSFIPKEDIILKLRPHSVI